MERHRSLGVNPCNQRQREVESNRRRVKFKGCDSKTAASSIFTLLGGGGGSSSAAAPTAPADPIAPAANGPVAPAAQAAPIAPAATTTTPVDARKRIKRQIAAGQKIYEDQLETSYKSLRGMRKKRPGAKVTGCPDWFKHNFKVFSKVPFTKKHPTDDDWVAPKYRAIWVMELWLAQFHHCYHIDQHQLDCPEVGCGCKLNAQRWKRKVVLESDGTYSIWSFKAYACNTANGCNKYCYGVDPRIIASHIHCVRELMDVIFVSPYLTSSDKNTRTLCRQKRPYRYFVLLINVLLV